MSVFYYREDYDPSRDASRAPENNYQNYGAAEKPSNTGMIIMSIINMVCCAFGIGFILGLIALIMSVLAVSENTIQEAKEKLKIARILNIIGIVLAVVQLILIIFFFTWLILGSPTSVNYGYHEFGRDFPFGNDSNPFGNEFPFGRFDFK